ncbi:hypothetical protein O7623_10200 [Solwaraspora sp. WMMD791]|nr:MULTISPECIES: hypothetical protein [unclassified Solwaraspora]WFE29526.1 hypothetical protein O7623_10200 [Solwaraspora sp. WMMD791]WJK43634.1 hypothetical protein O7608_15215 [Solwaraspora sp. WMMA2056]
MSASQDLPVTGAPAAALGLIGALSLAIGTALVTVARWGAALRRRRDR